MITQFQQPIKVSYFLMTDTDREPEAWVHRHESGVYSIFVCRRSFAELDAAMKNLRELDKVIKAGTYALPIGSERELTL